MFDLLEEKLYLYTFIVQFVDNNFNNLYYVQKNSLNCMLFIIF